MAGLGWQELTIILVIVIIIFGAGKLPEIGGALGKGIKEFKTESTAEEEQRLAEGTGGTTAQSSVARAEEPKVVETRQPRPDEI
jgi:sec-independent protein translocase protein TatA